MASLMTPNAARVSQDLDRLGAIGKIGETGVRRLAFSSEDSEARKYVMRRMEDAGLEVRVDGFGNIFGRRGGIDPSSACVMFGSHIDTTALAGRFDGVVGVIGALEVMHLVTDHSIITRRPMEAVVFAAEESTRFGVALLGSRATAGRLTVEDLLRLTDAEGVTLWHALTMAHFHPDALASCVIPRGYARAFVELHIEQGPVLESLRRPIGVVTAIAAPTRGMVTVRGQAAHSGATPMNLRRDALVAAAELIVGLERIARDESSNATVATVGLLEVQPGALNTIPGEAKFSIDIRSMDRLSKARAVHAFQNLVHRVQGERQVAIDLDVTTNDDPLVLKSELVEAIVAACRDAGIEPHYMPSGGSHDAQEAARYTDVGMIFVPSQGGISHAPEEYSSLDSVCLGIQVLAQSVLRLAES